ncbi:hypothetical protein [Saccharopolyspora sp. NPDC049426]|uniref:WXG100 family type VII secretion target n=1 Tax=Saccharopolyspora sp. NPDC049426 TaxID=3155652 RepID=UPI00341D17C1
MGGVSTRVEGSPESLRDTATKCTQLADLLDTEAASIHRTSGESEHAWKGDAADKGRTFIKESAKTIDTVVTAARKISGAHDRLAQDLDGVISRVNQARELAQKGKLAVTNAEILPPGPEPGPAPAAPQGPTSKEASGQHQNAMAAHGAALADFQAKKKAFDEASATVDQARQDERDAHHRFQEAVRESSTLLETVKGGLLFTSLGIMRTLASSPNANVAKYSDEARRLGRAASVAKAIASNPNMSPDRRAVARMIFFEREFPTMRATTNTLSSWAIDRHVPLPDSVKAMIAAAPGEELAAKGSNGFLRGVGSVAKAFPYSAIALTGVSTSVSIANGTPADKAVVSNVSSTALSTGAFVGAEVGLVALGVAGGPATLAAIGAGVVVSAGVSWFMDNHYDDMKKGASDLWHDIT